MDSNVAALKSWNIVLEIKSSANIFNANILITFIGCSLIAQQTGIICSYTLLYIYLAQEFGNMVNDGIQISPPEWIRIWSSNRIGTARSDIGHAIVSRTHVMYRDDGATPMNSLLH